MTAAAAPTERDVPAPAPAAPLQVAVSLAAVFGPLNSTMIAVALTDIRDDLGAGVGAIALLVSAYLIATAVLQPAGGRLGDAFGHLRIIQVGLLVLIVTSLGAALAWSFPVLIFWRSLQGAAAALTMPNVVAYLRKSVPVERLGGVLGFNASAISIGAAGGPLLGAAILAGGSWRLIFLVNVPLSLLAILLVSRLNADKGGGRKSFRLDAVSLASLASVFAGLTWLGSALRGSDPVQTAIAFALLAGGATLYAARYSRKRDGALELRLFTHRDFTIASVLVLLSNLIMYTTLIAIPVYLDDVKHASGVAIAVALFAMSAALIFVAPLAGGLADRFGDRVLIFAGGLVTAASVLAITFAIGRPPAIIIALLLLMGVGIAITGAPQQSTALKSWPASIAGSVAGSYSLMRYSGSIAGAAMLGAMLGDHAGASDYRLVFAILAGLGCVYLAVTCALRR